jgi:hypothetical protein
MTLTALLSAQLPAHSGGAEMPLAALLPVAGMTLVERQAEAAAAAGAKRILVLVDAIPAMLTVALDRIRARGLAVATVRDGPAVMDAAAGAAKLLLVADGLIAPSSAWSTMTASPAPTLLAVADAPATGALERIDAARRWAGLALLPAEALAELAELPPDWDPQLALLRSAIQAQVPTISCEPQLFERGDLALVDGMAAAELVEMRLLAAGTGEATGIVNARLLMPLARAVARPMLKGAYNGLIARAFALLGGAGAVVAMAFGFPGVATVAALLSAVANAAGTAMAAFRPESRAGQLMGVGGHWGMLVALLAAGWQAADRGGALAMWGSIGLTLLLAERLGALLAQRGLVNRQSVADAPAIWLVLALAQLFGLLAAGLALVTPLVVAVLIFAVWRAKKDNSV